MVSVNVRYKMPTKALRREAGRFESAHVHTHSPFLEAAGAESLDTIAYYSPLVLLRAWAALRDATLEICLL